MINAHRTSACQPLPAFRARGIGWTNLWRLAIRLCPAFALFGLALTGDPLLQWLSLLGFAPLAFAFLPGVPGMCGACHVDDAGRSILPPAH